MQKFYEPWTTLADWDFARADEWHSISSDEYVSSPTSLKLYRADMTAVEVVLCRIPTTLCLPQGEVRTWQYSANPTCRPAVFRNQAALGSSNHQNMYEILVWEGNARLSYYADYNPYTVQTQPCTVPVGQWNHWRVSWYNGFTPGEVASLCVDLYLEVAGEWQKQGATFYHTPNRWKDSEINRCGFRQNRSANVSYYFDDTEIWDLAPPAAMGGLCPMLL